MCDACCGLEIETDGDTVVAIRGDASDPISRGHICPKAWAMADVYFDPDRVTRPLKKTADGWCEIGWNQAFDEIGAKLRRIRREHGAQAVGSLLGNTTLHSDGVLYGFPLFVTALGLKRSQRFSSVSVDSLPFQLTMLEMYGNSAKLSVPDIDRTDLFICFGANPLVSNGSSMMSPDIKRRLAAIRERGGRIVMIDPRRTESARVADEHLFIRPGTDALMLAAMVNEVFSAGLVRLGPLQSVCGGLDSLRESVAPFTAESVAPVTGVEPAVIRELANELAGTERAVVYGRVGVSVQEFGTLAHWLIESLNAITGHLDTPGGRMFSSPAASLPFLSTVAMRGGSFDQRRTRVRGAPEFNDEFPAACLAEEIETPGEGQMRALFTIGANPALSLPNGRRVEAALRSLDLMVSIDIYVNETTCNAHYILPPTVALEREGYEVIMHSLALRDVARFSRRVFEPRDGQLDDWRILHELALRVHGVGRSIDRLWRAPVRRVLQVAGNPRRLTAALIALGRHGVLTRRRLTLGKVIDSVHGVDLGPLQSRLRRRSPLRRPRVNLAPERFVADVKRLRDRLDQATSEDHGALSLITRRDLRSSNSWLANSERLVRGRNRCTLIMNPDDASARSLSNGDEVLVESRVGQISLSLEVSDEVMPGVVCMPHGWGHDRPGARLRVAARHAGVSANDLTDDHVIDELGGTACFSGVEVHVTQGAPGGDRRSTQVGSDRAPA
jgi:anaerobic selenocysteine-containing dehydrogenase